MMDKLQVWSATERRIMATIMEPETQSVHEELGYIHDIVTIDKEGYNKEEVTVFRVPDEDKQLVLNTFYPFFPVPKLEDIRFDLHEQKSFKVSDFLLIQIDGLTTLVSPYFFKSGGMVIDWMDDKESFAKMFSKDEVVKND